MFLPSPITAALMFSHPESSPVASTTRIGIIRRDSGLAVSTDGQCGEGQTCLGSTYGDSCSQYGWCGSNTSYSGPGCQSGFGTCDNTSAETADPSSQAPGAPPTTTLTLFTTLTVTPSSFASPMYSSTSFSFVPGSDATSSAVGSSAPAPSSSASAANPSAPSSTSGTYRQVFLGDGSPASGWPVIDQWLDFETLWSANLAAVISKSCDQWNVPDNSPQESDDLKSAIEAIATAHNVDPRFALAVALQESNGCVRAPTTVGSVPNPGLFQSYEGTGTCNNDGSGTVPCPASEIQQMVNDGITGTVPNSMSIMAAVQKAGTSGAEQYYRAARIYNSGSIAPSGLLQDGVATHCYATDIANRLLGWTTGPTGCTLNA